MTVKILGRAQHVCRSVIIDLKDMNRDLKPVAFGEGLLFEQPVLNILMDRHGSAKLEHVPIAANVGDRPWIQWTKILYSEIRKTTTDIRLQQAVGMVSDEVVFRHGSYELMHVGFYKVSRLSMLVRLFRSFDELTLEEIAAMPYLSVGQIAYDGSSTKASSLACAMSLKTGKVTVERADTLSTEELEDWQEEADNLTMQLSVTDITKVQTSARSDW